MTNNATLAPELQQQTTVRWGQGPYAFELSSNDAEVIRQAAVVFRPWQTRAESSPPSRSWTITRADDLDQWTVRSSRATDALTRARPASAITAVEYQAVQTIFDGPPDVLTIHSALVARGGHGVVIAGVPESGKSTLACALWASGFSLLGDDLTIVDVDTAEARPAPRRVSLRAPSRGLLGETLWRRIAAAPATIPTSEGCLFHPDEIDGSRPETILLKTLIFLGRPGAPAEPGVLRPLPAAQAALAVLPYTNLARRMDTGDLIATLAGFIGGLHAYDLSRSSLADMVAVVTGALER